MFYIPSLKAFRAAKDTTHTLHNLYTPRGAKVRDGLLWSKYQQLALDMFGDDMEIVFSSATRITGRRVRCWPHAACRMPHAACRNMSFIHVLICHAKEHFQNMLLTQIFLDKIFDYKTPAGASTSYRDDQES
jgi:hypothetical protein